MRNRDTRRDSISIRGLSGHSGSRVTRPVPDVSSVSSSVIPTREREPFFFFFEEKMRIFHRLLAFHGVGTSPPSSILKNPPNLSTRSHYPTVQVGRYLLIVLRKTALLPPIPLYRRLLRIHRRKLSPQVCNWYTWASITEVCNRKDCWETNMSSRSLGFTRILRTLSTLCAPREASFPLIFEKKNILSADKPDIVSSRSGF